MTGAGPVMVQLDASLVVAVDEIAAVRSGAGRTTEIYVRGVGAPLIAKAYFTEVGQRLALARSGAAQVTFLAQDPPPT